MTKGSISPDGARRVLWYLSRTDPSTPHRTTGFRARPRCVAVHDFKRLLKAPTRSNVRGTTNRADACRRWRKGVNDQLMWLKRVLHALHGFNGVGNGGAIDLEAQYARWSPATGGSALLRCASTGPRGACAEELLRVPEASIWTLSGLLSMLPVHQHRKPLVGRANKGWISREGCTFALTFKHTAAVLLLHSWFWSIFRTVWDS